MNHFDESKEDTTPGHPAPNTAFRRAMAGVMERCRELAVRFDHRDTEGAEDAMRSAVTLWLAGREACCRVVESNRESSPYAQAARELLGDVYKHLLGIATRARALIKDQERRGGLDDIRMTLVQAMAQPLTESGAGERGKHCRSE
jgi:hypothetical protein